MRKSQLKSFPLPLLYHFFQFMAKNEKMIQKNFKRTELKYVIDHDTYQKLSEAFKDHLVADEFAQSTITNIYFDTSDFQMIQNAIAKKGGREKVRMRTYQANPDLSSQAFLEIKKKINDIGYKLIQNYG